MKRFFLDQILMLLIGVGLICVNFVFHLGYTVLTVIFAAVVIYLCRRILLLPLDLCFGRTEQSGFCMGRTAERCDVFSRNYYFHFQFNVTNRQKHGRRLWLILPIALPEKELRLMETPPENKMVTVVYYRFSHLLCEWRVSPPG